MSLRVKKETDRKKTGLYKPMARSRITNGKDLLPNIDHRSRWVRRFRDVLAQHLSDLGGADQVSHAEAAIARRASCLIVELEQMETVFAINGSATPNQLLEYGRGASTLRRLLETLGLQRRSKDVTTTLDQYLREKQRGEVVA
jgi:hypothetical protein